MEVKIFANSISHLTDARYFAAWGATWMCYNIRSISLTEIAAIKEWVEGPKHIIDVIGVDPSEVAAMMTNDAVDGYLTDNKADHESIQSLLTRPVQSFIIQEGYIDADQTIRTVIFSEDGAEQGALFMVNGNANQVVDFIKSHKPYGVLLSGSAEDKVGYKSFDEMDEILEALETEDL